MTALSIAAPIKNPFREYDRDNEIENLPSVTILTKKSSIVADAYDDFQYVDRIDAIKRHQRASESILEDARKEITRLYIREQTRAEKVALKRYLLTIAWLSLYSTIAAIALGAFIVLLEHEAYLFLFPCGFLAISFALLAYARLSTHLKEHHSLADD